MRIKTIASILVAFFFLSGSIYAQDWPSADYIVAKMQKELNLDQNQYIKVKLIIEDNMAKRQHITPQIPQGLTQAQSQSLDTELYDNLSEVLTRSQMSQWNRVLELILEAMDEGQGAK
ncbi:MAG: hypothetical protein HQL24_08950 [Candidatus Omnitrophica bacterium]|nr:hypothetical protein [Candidatus Omnitrophota bacterium]